ncbi:helicase RepA family protein [Mesorhizobium qingshengii]|uniref:Helicase RepA family protein n=1 Tax=Mesorhizobium qingshengii TaxID=1165689 RepID=A0ABT4QXK7_9HYPH|nr:AAA family ATPase [Mesorhizobium qingshengii]MCZ8546318.1 helicase RepA family protein [Mesorhizobium qingshengii]
MARDANDILRENGEANLRERIDGTRQTGGRGRETILGEWDAGDDTNPVPPRQWLLGNVFCRRFVSSLIADGGTGKTALRVAQALALATGRNLTGEYVFQRCRVLLVSLEDDKDELRRRVKAAMLHHDVSEAEVKGWLFLAAPGGKAGKLMTPGDKGRVTTAGLAAALKQTVQRRKVDFVCLDPFVKTHGLSENDNSLMDQVIEFLANLAIEMNIALDVPHHTAKGSANPGNADRGRGASAIKDGARLVYTLTTMSDDEAATFGVPPADRRLYVRVDAGKVNIAPPAAAAKWFRLVNVALGNGNDLYPGGDNVQTVEPWAAPGTWEGLTDELVNRILTDIDAGTGDGELYSAASSATSRAAWKVVQKHAAKKTEKQCRDMVATWVKSGLLFKETYRSPGTRKDQEGLHVDDMKRPGKVGT